MRSDHLHEEAKQLLREVKATRASNQPSLATESPSSSEGEEGCTQQEGAEQEGEESESGTEQDSTQDSQVTEK